MNPEMLAYCPAPRSGALMAVVMRAAAEPPQGGAPNSIRPECTGDAKRRVHEGR
jgi:hypothetical protein